MKARGLARRALLIVLFTLTVIGLLAWVGRCSTDRPFIYQISRITPATSAGAA